jgi:septal ring factor EnvC (AmiA/AmiB activator)
MKDYKIIRVWKILVFFLVGTVSLPAQEKIQDLETKRVKLEQEIRENLQTIEKLKKSNKSISQEIYLLEKNIRNRKKMLEAINQELALMDRQIVIISNQINKTEQDLNHQRREYERLIIEFQRNYKQYDLLQFILSAESFNQAFLRFHYYKQYKDYLRQEIERIRQTNNKLVSQMTEINEAKKQRTNIIDRQQKEIAKLNSDKEQKNKAMARAKEQERELRKYVERKRKSLQLISEAIKKIIEEEAALAAKRAKESAKKEGKTVSPKSTYETLYSPADIQLSGEFKSARGSLPWPVEKGVISESFGEHPHPVLKGIRVKNNGLTISTEKGARVKAVFGGIVSKIMRISTENQVVILRHGQYLTVYSELVEIMVKEGQQVKAGEVLGYLSTNDDPTNVHFEVWNQKTPEDPIIWLKR